MENNFKLFPKERISLWREEQRVDMVVPQRVEETVEVMQTIPLLERAEEVPLKCLVSRTAEQVHVCLFLHFRLLWSSTVVRATFDGISCFSVMPLGRTRSRFTFLQKKDEKTTAKICSQRMGAL